MRLLVHAAGIVTGGGLRHLLAFLPALRDALPPHAHVWVTTRSSVASALAGDDQRMTFLPVLDRVASAPLLRVPLDNIWIPKLARELDIDVVVSFANFGPARPGRPHIVFQTNALYFSDIATEQASPAQRARLFLRRSLAVATMHAATVIVTPSEAMADLVSAHVPSARARIRCLPNGATLPERAQRGSFVAGSRPFQFLCPGVGAPHKGLEVLVPALPQIGEGNYIVRALGSEADWPSELRGARSLASKLGVADRLRLEPEVEFDAMGLAYASADAMVYPTLCESFGFSLLEALASGLPVIASDLPVNRELAGEAALFYQARSPSALAAAMREVLHDASLRERLAHAAVERVRTRNWSWTRYAQEFVQLCEGACGKPT